MIQYFDKHISFGHLAGRMFRYAASTGTPHAERLRSQGGRGHGSGEPVSAKDYEIENPAR